MKLNRRLFLLSAAAAGMHVVAADTPKRSPRSSPRMTWSESESERTSPPRWFQSKDVPRHLRSDPKKAAATHGDRRHDGYKTKTTGKTDTQDDAAEQLPYAQGRPAAAGGFAVTDDVRPSLL